MAFGTFFKFVGDRRGGLAVAFGLSAPVLAAAVGATIEYGNLALQRTRLQKAVDYAAVAAARELALANANDRAVQSGARTRVVDAMKEHAASDAMAIESAVVNNRRSVEVSAVLTVDGWMGRALSWPTGTVDARATGTLVGQSRLCILALTPNESDAIVLEKSSKVTASQCSVYSNSRLMNGVTVKDFSVVDAQSVCSAGGYAGLPIVNYTQTPRTGCPAIPDPLASRTPPPGSGCDYTGLEVKGGTRALSPGVYCKGLKITDRAVVTLSPGAYVIDGGKLEVDNNATLQGDYAGIYLRGPDATLKFEKDSVISLSAPKTGEMSGLLVFEDRTAPLGREHLIKSSNARKLLGTIYLPRGKLRVETDKPVADQSAYTVIVAKQIQLKEGPNLVMNAMYAQSDVPVPEGVGPNGGSVALTR